MLNLVISTQMSYFCDIDAIYDVIMQEPVGNDVMTTDIKSVGIHLLNNHSLRPSQSFSFLDKSTGPILPLMVLALYKSQLKHALFANCGRVCAGKRAHLEWGSARDCISHLK